MLSGTSNLSGYLFGLLKITFGKITKQIGNNSLNFDLHFLLNLAIIILCVNLVCFLSAKYAILYQPKEVLCKFTGIHKRIRKYINMF